MARRSAWRPMAHGDADVARAAIAAGRTTDPVLSVRVPADGNHFPAPARGIIVGVARARTPVEYVRVHVAGDDLPFAPDELLIPRYRRSARTPPPAAPPALFDAPGGSRQ